MVLWNRRPFLLAGAQEFRSDVLAVEDRTFKFRRVIVGRNSFIPIITGQIFVAAFMTFWMGMFVGPTVSEVSKALREHHVSAALDVVFFPLFGIALMVFGYYPERRKAMRLLADAFQVKVGDDSPSMPVK